MPIAVALLRSAVVCGQPVQKAHTRAAQPSGQVAASLPAHMPGRAVAELLR
jgi:hypothetical protein